MIKTLDISKVRLLGCVVSVSFLIIDIAMLLFFQYYGVTPLTYYHIFSICFYLASFVLLKNDNFWLFTVSVYLEVLLHVGIVVYITGASSGFQLALIGMNLVAFYSEYLSVKFRFPHVSGIVLSSMGLLLYMASFRFGRGYRPPYPMAVNVTVWTQLIWGCIVFLVNIVFLKVFVVITLNSERLLAEAQSQANSMVTALSADYRSVYYVNLDNDTGICYRGDKRDPQQIKKETEFSFYEYFSEYGHYYVAESYREGFMNFIKPDNIRENLAERPVIAYRYLVKRQGNEYYEMIRMAGVRNVEERDDNMVHSIGVAFADIDEEMRVTMARNEALAEALVVAEEASKAKTAFLSSMSHEIRTPMNAIIGLDNLALRDEGISTQTREYLEKIGSSAQHLLALINDILDMSRIESGRMVLRMEEFSFRGMLDQINTMVMSQCSDKGISYECRVLNQMDDYYIGDDMKLKEVLINILSNAIKFTEAAGSVTMTVERTAVFEGQSTIQFRIKDTGIGMDKDYIPKIFDTFSQEDSSRKNKYGSTGLGMAITKNLVEMMNGSIDVDSEKGVGTEFTVSLTFKNSDYKENDQDKAIEAGRIHVLLADADELAAENNRLVLEEAGIRTDLCTSWEELLKMLKLMQVKHDPYNLLLLDRNISTTRGEEASAEIRKYYDRENMAVISTAYSWGDIQMEDHAGADGFLTKPLIASNVTGEFERLARRNHMNVSRDKMQADLKGRRILLAEDVEINAEIMKEILKMSDMDVDHAENGRIVVEMFAHSLPGTYAAVLMDVRMPEMDGLEAAAAIRALDREDAKLIPIIALTANAFDEDVQRSLQAGMNAHLTKPVEPEQMLQILGELVYEAEN